MTVLNSCGMHLFSHILTGTGILREICLEEPVNWLLFFEIMLKNFLQEIIELFYCWCTWTHRNNLLSIAFCLSLKIRAISCKFYVVGKTYKHFSWPKGRIIPCPWQLKVAVSQSCRWVRLNKQQQGKTEACTWYMHICDRNNATVLAIRGLAIFFLFHHWQNPPFFGVHF